MLRETRYAMASIGLLAFSMAQANENQLELQQNPELWATQLGNYEGHRYSELDQITRENIQELRPEWQFSTADYAATKAAPYTLAMDAFTFTPPSPTKSLPSTWRTMAVRLEL